MNVEVNHVDSKSLYLRNQTKHRTTPFSSQNQRGGCVQKQIQSKELPRCSKLQWLGNDLHDMNPMSCRQPRPERRLSRTPQQCDACKQLSAATTIIHDRLPAPC